MAEEYVERKFNVEAFKSTFAPQYAIMLLVNLLVKIMGTDLTDIVFGYLMQKQSLSTLECNVIFGTSSPRFCSITVPFISGFDNNLKIGFCVELSAATSTTSISAKKNWILYDEKRPTKLSLQFNTHALLYLDIFSLNYP
jgi:hypothetical protein